MSEKPKIEWICLSSGVDKIMPVIKASEHKPSWIKRAAEDFKKEGSITKQVRKGEQMYVDPAYEKFKPEETRHTSKCPALQLFHNSGYIIRLHQDVIVDVAPDGNNFVVKSPEQQLPQQQRMSIITAHMEQSMYPFFENWPKDTMKKILKFNLPWAARIPKGYKLLQIHPFYQDDFRFTAPQGAWPEGHTLMVDDTTTGNSWPVLSNTMERPACITIMDHGMAMIPLSLSNFRTQ